MSNDELPLVSVVVSTYNQARYLDEAIDSVLARTAREDEEKRSERW